MILSLLRPLKSRWIFLLGRPSCQTSNTALVSKSTMQNGARTDCHGLLPSTLLFYDCCEEVTVLLPACTIKMQGKYQLTSTDSAHGLIQVPRHHIVCFGCQLLLSKQLDSFVDCLHWVHVREVPAAL